MERDRTLRVQKPLFYSVFQLTRSRGAWLWNTQITGVKLEISTHTLTWSVTWISSYQKWKYWISTHTLTWSVTSNVFCSWFIRQFQLTRSRGAWHVDNYVRKLIDNFNSHAHVERDILYIYHSCKDTLFQLTRSRGAWRKTWQKLRKPLQFQLTRSRGAWQRYYHIISADVEFQLTRSRGAWLVVSLSRS